MNPFDETSVQWRKSSRSGGDSGQCVQVAQLCGTVGIRDSKNPSGPVLRLRRDELASLLHDIKAGDLDR
jgi:hypothetical protein